RRPSNTPWRASCSSNAMRSRRALPKMACRCSTRARTSSRSLPSTVTWLSKRAVHSRAPAQPAAHGGFGPLLTAEVAVVHRRAAESASWQQSVAGNNPHTYPARALVETLGVVAGGVEYQQRLAAFARRDFGGSHQRCAQSLTACPAMHQHLRETGAVRL